MIPNSEIVGLVALAVFVIPYIGLKIWVRIRYPTRDGVEADPLAEAEVYAHYGKKARAIEILENAILIDPNRRELAAKLAALRGKK